jgi:hypothetical protein
MVDPGNDDRSAGGPSGSLPAPRAHAAEGRDDASDNSNGEEGVSDADQSKDEKESRGAIARVPGFTKGPFGVVSNLLLLAVIVGRVVVIAKGFSTRAIVLDLIEVPDDFAKQFATSNSVSRRLADRLAFIQDQSSEGGLSRKRLLEPAWLQADIKVPGAGLSVQAIVSFFKQEFGHEDIHSGGEITSSGPENYV